MALRKDTNSKMDDREANSKTITYALMDWIESLPPSDRKANCIYFSAVGYSPLEIYDAVIRETELGKEFVAGLRALQLRMEARGINVSVADLIRRSTHADQAAGAAGGI